MTARVEFFFSFRSPYSYLAAPRAFALAERFDVEVAFRGVIPMAMRGQAVPRAKRLHTLRDVDARGGAPRACRSAASTTRSAPARCAACCVAEHAVDVGRERAFVLEASRGDLGRGGRRRRATPGCGASASAAGLSWAACAAALEDPAPAGAGRREHGGAGRAGPLGRAAARPSRASCSGARTAIEDVEDVAARRGTGALMAAPEPAAEPRPVDHRPAARAAALARRSPAGSTRSCPTTPSCAGPG